MPLTFSHPAAAIPFTRWGLPLSALVVGSMAPDFPYFLTLSTKKQFGHSLSGLILFCLPVGLLVLGIFHGVLKRPLLSLLPTLHQKRLIGVSDGFRFWPFSCFCLVVAGVLLGAVTHLCWDSCTHANGWAVQHLSLLRLPLVQTPRGTVYLFKGLQHLSTVSGAALLVFWYWRWSKQAPMATLALPERYTFQQRRSIITGGTAAAILIAVLYSVLTISSFVGTKWLAPFARDLVLVSIGVILLELFAFSTFWHLAKGDTK